MSNWSDTDPRNKTTNFILNGQPYDGAYHIIFGSSGKLGSGKPQYWTGVHHYALSEKLVYTSTPVFMPRNDVQLLARAEREPNTIFNTFKPTLFTDTLNDSAGMPLFSRTIVPERLKADKPQNPLARAQAFTDMRTPFMPRQGIGGSPDVLYNPLLSPSELRARALGGEPVRRPPPESGTRAPFTYDPQPEYVPTQPMPDPLVPTPYYPPSAFQSPARITGAQMQARTPVTSAPFRSPQTPTTASPRASMQALPGLPAVTFTASTPSPPPAMLARPTIEADTLPKPPTPSITRTKSAGRKAQIQPAYVEYSGQAGPSTSYTNFESPPVSKRQKLLGEINLRLGLTVDERVKMGKFSDLRTIKPTSDKDINAQLARLLSNEIIIQKIIKAYGDLKSADARSAVGAVFGVNKLIVDVFMDMRRTAGM
ncbi:hypothetical protein T492DRAFT_848365 [Pavlovales sp. CCMP2436]|nr:hypothetical protein T492DRAFT_848365 [Pavlovales sp. CCMP2436]